MSECHDVYDLEGWPTSAEVTLGSTASKPWTVSIAWCHEGSFLHANATLVGEDFVVEGDGDARLSAYGTGPELAATRALINLSHQLVERAARVAVRA
jgi:hypothetical protein